MTKKKRKYHQHVLYSIHTDVQSLCRVLPLSTLYNLRQVKSGVVSVYLGSGKVKNSR